MPRGEDKDSLQATWFVLKWKHRFFRLYNSSFISKSDCFILFYVLIRKQSGRKVDLNERNLFSLHKFTESHKGKLFLTLIICKQLPSFCKHAFPPWKSGQLFEKYSDLAYLYGFAIKYIETKIYGNIFQISS